MLATCCSSDVAQLKEKQLDYTAQHHIAVDLFNKIRATGKFNYRSQCILQAVKLIAVTISNLQIVEVVMSQTEGISKDEVEQFHKTVKDYVYDLLKQVKQWLPIALPPTVGTQFELDVSMILLLYYKFSVIYTNLSFFHVMLCVNAAYAIMLQLASCSSVCLSHSCILLKLLNISSNSVAFSPTILVFPYTILQQNSDRVPLKGGI